MHLYLFTISNMTNMERVRKRRKDRPKKLAPRRTQQSSSTAAKRMIVHFADKRLKLVVLLHIFII